jgi:hypothetical protein
MSIGAERLLPWMSLRVGGYYRWTEPNESNLLNPNPRGTVVYPILGLDEPFGLAKAPGTATMFVRNESRATVAGGTLALVLAGADVVLTHERGGRADDQTQVPFLAIRSDIDSWRADAHESRLLVQRGLRGGVIATLIGSIQSLEGEGRRSDLAGLSFVGREGRRAVEIDLRTPAVRSWSAALVGGVVQSEQALRDFAAQLELESQVLTPFVSIEGARRVGRAAVALGVSAASMSPQSARLPSAIERGEQYQRLLAPAFAYHVAEATALGAWLTGTFPVRGATLVGSIRGEQASPRSSAPQRLQPGGERNAWSVSFGVRR